LTDMGEILYVELPKALRKLKERLVSATDDPSLKWIIFLLAPNDETMAEEVEIWPSKTSDELRRSKIRRNQQ